MAIMPAQVIRTPRQNSGSAPLNTIALADLVDDRPQDGLFRVHRRAFTDQQVFELEMKYIFERTWSFLGLESQVRNADDFITNHIGRTPVIIARDAAGKVGAFLNACPHKGLQISRTENGNTRRWTCPYHGWIFDTSGKNVHVKDEAVGAYTEAWSQQDHNLIPLPRFAIHKGLMFGCLDANAPDLDQFLGGMKALIDLAAEQSPHGMEFIPGRIRYTYDANWKLQMDNGMDRYHLTSAHTSFMEVVERREAARTGNTAARAYDLKKRLVQEGGTWTFPHGHVCTWLTQSQPEKKPLYRQLDELKKRVGEVKAHWMLQNKGMTIFPNMQIADNTSLLIRTYRPLAVDKTEMRYWCMAPIGEDAETRAWRIRQFEDFFNVSGLATPDDTTCYEDTQAGFAAQGLDWLQGYQRGMAGTMLTGDAVPKHALGFTPLTQLDAPYNMQAEVGFHSTYREWRRLLQAGLDEERAR